VSHHPFTEATDLTVAGGPVRLYSCGPAHGPPVLLLHGAMLDTARGTWMHLAPELARHGYRVLAPDLPRHGGSRPWRGRLGPARLEQVLEELLDAVGVTRTSVVGMSMGGGIALGQLLRRPERYTAAVLAAPGGLGARRPWQLTTYLVQRTPGFLVWSSWLMARFPRLLRSSTLAALPGGTDTPGVEALLELAEEEARAKHRHREPALDDWQTLSYGPFSMRTDYLPELHRVQVPVLWLRGEEDTLVRRPETDAAAAATPGSEYVTIARAGHVSMLDRPEVFARHVLDFLQRRAAGASAHL